MRSFVLVAFLALPLGCAHRNQNLAVRKNDKPPRGDFSRTHAQNGDRDQPRPEVPLAHPTVP